MKILFTLERKRRIIHQFIIKFWRIIQLLLKRFIRNSCIYYNLLTTIIRIFSQNLNKTAAIVWKKMSYKIRNCSVLIRFVGSIDRELIVDSLLMEVGSALSHLSFIINILRMVFRAVTFYIPFFKLLMFYLNLQCLTQWRVNSFKFRQTRYS